MHSVLWSRWFAVLLTLLCLVAAIAYVAAPYELVLGDASAAQSIPVPYTVFLLAAIACASGWFAYAFTGDPVGRRHEQVKFAYFFVIGSFAALMIPPFMKSESIGGEPVGIVSGCVKDDAAPAQLRCDPDETPAGKTGAQGKQEAAPAPAKAAGAAPKPAHDQWLVNVGGALRAQSERCTSDQAAKCRLGSSGRRVEVTGGIVVPLPFVVIALFGGAISLSRRVPEIQKRSEDGYVGTATQPKIDARQAREELVFQIMQFVSAPLIAITAHQVIAPQGQASAVALAFLAGFGSETILLMIRGVANGLQPRAAPSNAEGTTSAPAAAGGGVRARGPGAGEAAAGGLPAPVMLGLGPAGASAEPVHIRLCVDDDLEAGSLALRVDGLPADVPRDGCVELELAPGRAHRVEAHGRRAGRPVHGELALTARADDDGRPVRLALG